MLLDLVIPGAATVVDALGKILALCEDMREGQEACQRLHVRLAYIKIELVEMEDQGRLPTSDALTKYFATLSNALRLLGRYRGKKLVPRLIQHNKMMDELRRIHEGVDMLFRVLQLATTSVMMDWKKQWEADRQAQENFMAATISNCGAILCELQSMRAQAEAILTLKFEMEQRGAQQTETPMNLIKSAFTTVVKASRVVVKTLPPWFLPSGEVAYKQEPFDRGSFGSVHHGVWGRGTKVVVKCIPSDGFTMGDSASQRIVTEIDMWFGLYHPNVVKMFGASHVSSPAFIVCEDATNGNLCSFLACSAENKRQMWRLLYQAGLGLDYIHKNRIVHGDLKLNNILVGADELAKVSDFGLSAIRTSSTVSDTPDTAKGAGGLRWRAPECLRSRPTFASDVYSFAMCMIEAVLGEPPFAFLDDNLVYNNLEKGYIPERPEGMTEDAWQLVVSITHKDRKKRVSLSQVLDKLKVLAETEEELACRDEYTYCSFCCSAVSSKFRFCPSCGKHLGSSLESPSTTNDFPTKFAVQYPSHCTTASRSFSDVSASAPGHGSYISQSSLMGDAELWSPNSKQGGNGLAEAESRVSELVYLLQSGTDDQKQSSARTLANLAYHLIESRSKIGNAGGILPLVSLVRGGSDEQKQVAAGALTCLADGHLGNQWKISACDPIQPLLALVRGGTDGQKQVAAWTLAYLACGHDHNRGRIANVGGISPLVALMQSGTDEQKHAAVAAIRNLTHHFSENRSKVADAGAIRQLVALVKSGTDQQKQVAAAAIRNLTFDHHQNRSEVAEAGGISPLVALVESGTDGQKEEAAAALQRLAYAHSGNQLRIAEAGAIWPLVALIRVGTSGQKRWAADVLCNLACTHDGNRSRIAEAGGIPPLVLLVQDGTDEQKFEAVAALKCLADGHYDNKSKIVEAGAIQPILVLVRGGTDEQKWQAAWTLANLAHRHGGNKAKIVDEGGISPLVALAKYGTNQQGYQARRTLQGLADGHSGNQTKIAEAEGIKLLVTVLGGKSAVKMKDRVKAMLGAFRQPTAQSPPCLDV